jgi:hypothetical protein
MSPFGTLPPAPGRCRQTQKSPPADAFAGRRGMGRRVVVFIRVLRRLPCGPYWGAKWILGLMIVVVGPSGASGRMVRCITWLSCSSNRCGSLLERAYCSRQESTSRPDLSALYNTTAWSPPPEPIHHTLHPRRASHVPTGYRQEPCNLMHNPSKSAAREKYGTMATRIVYDNDQGAAFIRRTGRINPGEMLKGTMDLESNPLFGDTSKGLSDVSAADFSGISAGELEYHAQYCATRLRDFKMAIVAPSDVLYGLSRRFEILSHNNGKENLLITREMSEALSWLDVVLPEDF